MTVRDIEIICDEKNIYVFDYWITQNELMTELNDLRQWYKKVEVRSDLPPHIDKNIIKENELYASTDLVKRC